MRLLVLPEDGVEPLLEALGGARTSIEMLVFRLDYPEIEHALMEAALRGVRVHVLMALANRGEQAALLRLEGRLMESGIAVTRTAEDLLRYHGKMFVVDRREVWVLTFNYTYRDMALSRAFGVGLRSPAVVAAAVELFEADARRRVYRAACADFLVSPLNARGQLMAFIRGARRQLLVYEMKRSDAVYARLLLEKQAEGVEVRVIGRVRLGRKPLEVRTVPMRLHARAILRDGREAFVGSQGLRKRELQARREVGVVVREAELVRGMVEVFERDWEMGEGWV